MNSFPLNVYNDNSCVSKYCWIGLQRPYRDDPPPSQWKYFLVLLAENSDLLINENS